MNKKLFWLAVLLVAATALSACVTPPPQGPASQPAAGDQPVDNAPGSEPPAEEPPAGAAEDALAVVESVDVMILESFPVQVNVVVTGYLPDGCTTIDQVTTVQNGNEFVVTITTQRPADAMCTLALVPYEETVALEVADLPAGQYTVTVNGVSGSFTLDADNG